MHVREAAIVCASRHHGEAGTIVRVLTAGHGLLAGYVAGGRGRRMRPVLIPGNLVEAELRARHGSQLPGLRLELLRSRGPWLTEPLPAAAIGWITALAAAAIPERQPCRPLFDALAALLEAICVAPSARGWAGALLAWEMLLLRELGYGEPVARPESDEWEAILRGFDLIGRHLSRYPLAERRGDVMAARGLLRERLARIQE